MAYAGMGITESKSETGNIGGIKLEKVSRTEQFKDMPHQPASNSHRNLSKMVNNL